MSLVAVPVPSGDPEDARDRAQAFDDVFRSYAPRVKALAERRLPGRNAGDDVVQETFLRVYRSFEAIDPDRPIWPWLKTVAHNVCVDMIRQHRRHTDRDAALDDNAERTLVCPNGDPGDAHAAALRRVSIETALAMINPRQRRVVVLKDVEGWDTEQVADIEGVTVEALKSTLKRGRQTFRASYLALAAKHGLLGAFFTLGASVTGAFKRFLGKARASDTTTLGGALPIASVVPLVAVLAIAGGAFVAHDQLGRDRSVALDSGGRTELAVATRTSAVMGAAKLAVHADVPGGGTVGLDADPAAGATARAETQVINPLGDDGNVEAEARFERSDALATIAVEVTVRDPWGETRVTYGREFRCKGEPVDGMGEAFNDGRCDTVEAAWDAATNP